MSPDDCGLFGPVVTKCQQLADTLKQAEPNIAAQQKQQAVAFVQDCLTKIRTALASAVDSVKESLQNAVCLLGTTLEGLKMLHVLSYCCRS